MVGRYRQGIGKLYARYMKGICWIYVRYMLDIARLGDGEVEKNVENSESTVNC